LSGDISYISNGIYVSTISIKETQLNYIHRYEEDIQQGQLPIDQPDWRKELCSLDVTENDKGAPRWMKDPTNNYKHVSMRDLYVSTSAEYVLRSEIAIAEAVDWILNKTAQGFFVCVNC
jgi:hypothetical protein